MSYLSLAAVERPPEARNSLILYKNPFKRGFPCPIASAHRASCPGPWWVKGSKWKRRVHLRSMPWLPMSSRGYTGGVVGNRRHELTHLRLNSITVLHFLRLLFLDPYNTDVKKYIRGSRNEATLKA